MRIYDALVCLLCLALLGGCQTWRQQDSGPVKPRELTLSDMAKSDVDMVAEASFRHSRSYLRELAGKLYRRNPKQLRRAGGLALDEALGRIFMEHGCTLPELRGRRSAKAVELAFSDGFPGDRVAALVRGLYDMQRDAYGGSGEFFMHHNYDPQKVYHLARNYEIASWRLRNERDAAGRLHLLSVGEDQGGIVNTSYERLFGKLIGLQDHFAHVIADTTNRRIKNVLQGVASMVFFPI